MVENENNTKGYMLSIDKRKKVFCGVQDSTCTKNLRFYNHSLCCLKCEYNCSKCSVKKISQCDQLCSKEDIILDRIQLLTKEKDKHIKALDNIYIEIDKLSKDLK